MNIRLPLTRAVLAAAIAALMTGSAIAGTTAQADTDETRVAVSTQAGTIERVTIADIDAMQPGETRALSTDSGAAAAVTRTDAGFTLQIAGESFDVSLPGAADELTLLSGGHHLIIDKDLVRSEANGDDHQQLKKVIVIKSKHSSATDAADVADVDAEIQADILSDAMAEEELLADGPGDGKRIMVVRKVIRHDEVTPAQ